VHEKVRSGDIDLCAAQTILDPARQIIRGRQRLASINLTSVVHRDQVGKRSTYIDGDSHGSFELIG